MPESNEELISTPQIAQEFDMDTWFLSKARADGLIVGYKRRGMGNKLFFKRKDVMKLVEARGELIPAAPPKLNQKKAS
jgi:hypothetical protein